MKIQPLNSLQSNSRRTRKVKYNWLRVNLRPKTNTMTNPPTRIVRKLSRIVKLNWTVIRCYQNRFTHRCLCTRMERIIKSAYVYPELNTLCLVRAFCSLKGYLQRRLTSTWTTSSMTGIINWYALLCSTTSLIRSSGFSTNSATVILTIIVMELREVSVAAPVKCAYMW